MEKKLVKRQECIDIETSFEQIQKEFEGFTSKYPNGSNFCVDSYYDWGTKRYMMVCDELETDSEFQERCERQKEVEISQGIKEREHIKEVAEREKEGYVYTDYRKEYNREDAQGGLSDKLWNFAGTVSYTKTSCFGFGYFGHSCRKPELDQFIEKTFKDHGATIDEISTWMASTYGRHSGDSLKNATFAEQIDYVKSAIEGWIADAKRMVEEE